MSEACLTCGLAAATVASIQHCGLNRDIQPEEDCVWRDLASEDLFRVTYRYRDGTTSLHEHLNINALPSLWFQQDWRSITGATIERET